MKLVKIHKEDGKPIEYEVKLSLQELIKMKETVVEKVSADDALKDETLHRLILDIVDIMEATK